MKELLLPVIQKFLRTLFLVTIALGASLAASGELKLLAAVFAGYFIGAIYFWNMAFRVWRSSGFSLKRANMEMAWGLCLRLLTAVAILAVAARISSEVFFSAVGGFLLFYLLAVLHLLGAGFGKK